MWPPTTPKGPTGFPSRVRKPGDDRVVRALAASDDVGALRLDGEPGATILQTEPKSGDDDL